MPEHELPGAGARAAGYRVPGALLPRGNGFSVLRIFLKSLRTPRLPPETRDPRVSRRKLAISKSACCRVASCRVASCRVVVCRDKMAARLLRLRYVEQGLFVALRREFLTTLLDPGFLASHSWIPGFRRLTRGSRVPVVSLVIPVFQPIFS